MKLERAIEILDVTHGLFRFYPTPERLKARRLGIEALRRILFLRGYSMTQVDTKLPGETEE